MVRLAVLAILVSCCAACTAGSDAASSATAPASSATADACAGAIVDGPLPEWARTGFTPPDQSVPHVVGERGDIVAVLFGYPLQSPPGSERGNKVLWVGRVLDGGPQDLVVHGTSAAGGTVDESVAGGPGPSIIDVPSAGCWTFDLTWGTHSDRMHVPYGPPDS